MDEDPLDTGIHIDLSDGCIGLLVVTTVGAVVVVAGVVLSLLNGLGWELP